MNSHTEQALLGSAALAGWGSLLKPAVYLLLAGTCAYLGSSRELAQRTSPAVQMTWVRLVPLYLLVAASTFVGGDVLWVSWVREFANEHHLYQSRRYFQIAFIAVTALMSLALLERHRSKVRQLGRVPADIAQTMLLVGACGTAILYLLRYVSFHYADLVLNTVWLDFRADAWLELSSLGLFGLGTLIELLRSYGHV